MSQKFARREIGEIVQFSGQKNKISPDSLTVATAWIAPKICQSQPQQCTESTPGFIQIGLHRQLYFTTNVVAKKTYIIKQNLNKLNKLNK